jgi:hypothetical protein
MKVRMTLSFLRVLWIASLAGYALLLGRLLQTGLHRTYRAFTLYILIQIAQSVMLLPFAPRSNAYSLIYQISQPIVCLLCILVVVELYSLVFERYPGIARSGRYALGGGLFVSLLISLALSYPRLSSPGEMYPRFLIYVNSERILLFALLLFILILNALLAYFPVPLNRNTVFYFSGFSVYFIAKIMAQVVRAITGHEATRSLGACMLVISLLCTVFWAIVLRRAGETKVVVTRPCRHSDRERLFGQLANLNAFLAKPGGRGPVEF